MSEADVNEAKTTEAAAALGTPAEVEVRRQNGESAGRVALDPAVFDAQVNVPVMHQVVRAQLAAARSGTHATKTRGEVRGGGKKPWRQKGTGRARQGSTRAPQWKGGGVVWGPHPRDHSMKVPKKMKALALRSALTDRAREGKVLVVERWEFEAPSTKQATEFLRTVGAEGAVLLVFDAMDDAAIRSFRNLGHVHMVTVDQLNTYDVLRSDTVVFTKAALEATNSGKRERSGSGGGSEEDASGGGEVA